MSKRKGRVSLDGLDGAREREFTLPDNWDQLDDAGREAVWRPVKERLMDDTVSWSLEIDGECGDCEQSSGECGCWDEEI